MTIFNALWYLELVTDLENTSINKEKKLVHKLQSSRIF